MSQKIEDGLNYWLNTRFLLKRPEEGGWILGKSVSWTSYDFYSSGWGWSEGHEEEYRGAALVAPLSLIYWEYCDG